MLLGIIYGFSAAILNSAGYLCSAGFLLRYKSPVRLLVVVSLLMMLICLPLLICFFPFGMILDWGSYLGLGIASCVCFLVGQGAFFAALRYFEASRLSSLLGLKIIVLSAIFMLAGGVLNWMKLLAVLVAAAAAMLFNWSGGGKSPLKGCIFLALTLVCYSTVDMLETHMVIMTREFTGMSTLHSSFLTVLLMYVILGILVLPGLFFYRIDRKQMLCALPYASLWLLSQVVLFCCYALIAPVFGKNTGKVVAFCLDSGDHLFFVGFRSCNDFGTFGLGIVFSFHPVGFRAAHGQLIA